MPPTPKDLRIPAPTKAVVQAMLKNKGEKPKPQPIKSE